jgi:hypothetical protein
MHANTFRRAPLAGGPVRRAPAVHNPDGQGEGEPERRLNRTSALLVLLAVLGVVVTIAFGIWMIDVVQPSA